MRKPGIKLKPQFDLALISCQASRGASEVDLLLWFLFANWGTVGPAAAFTVAFFVSR